MNTKTIPWVEKYRPIHLDDVVLDKYNKIILSNIIKNDHFPNLLFYGPPGTGKTTTIINLIDAYQIQMNQKYKGLMIHLNASDERGIDIVRNQIATFVNSTGLFNNGMKFVVLDEVDYMTKNAQQALKYLLQDFSQNVRYCLICNYISRIDESLQNEFIRLRFNKLPVNDITKFLKNVVHKEKINVSTNTIKHIQYLYQSDIRSMINYIQSNQTMLLDNKIINHHVWDGLTESLKVKGFDENQILINSISIQYVIEKKNLLKDYFNYLIKKNMYISHDLLDFIENLLHNINVSTNYFVKYAILRLSLHLSDIEL